MEKNQVDINLSTDIKTDNLIPLNITLMSRDINNNSFLLKFKSNGADVQLNNSFTVEILSVFPNSKIEILTQATVYGNTAVWEFDTKYITRNELVSNYVYVKKDGAPIISADANAFTFNVGLSKIDENAGKVAETYDRNYEKVLHEFEVAINLTKDEWAQMADEARSFVDEIKDVTVDEFVELKMGEELANLETNYATRLTGLEQKDNQITAQLAQTVEKLNPSEYQKYPVVTIIDDDAYSSFLERWKPLADSKGIKLNIATITGHVGSAGKMTLANLKQLESEGFEILSHSHTHKNPINTTDEVWANDFQLSKDWMINNGFTNTNAVVYPYGFSQVSADVAIAKKNAIRPIFDYGLDYDTFGGVNNKAIDKYQILRYNGAILNETTIKAKVDEAILNKSWLIITTHSNAYWDETIYGNVIDYIKSKNVPIQTFSEALTQFETTINIGDINGEYFFLNKRGEVNYSGMVEGEVGIPSWAKSTQPYTYNIDTPATEYEKYMVTTTEVRTPSDTYFNTGGTLETYHGNSGFSYQTFRLFNAQKVYERKWIDASSAWGIFYEISQMTSLAPSSYNMDAPISSYRQYVFTDVEVKTGSDLYFNTGGLMRVYSGSVGFSFALFYLYNSNVVYKRRWSGSAWLPFEKISAV